MSHFSNDSKTSHQASHLSDEQLHRLLLDAHNAATLRHKLALIDIEGDQRLAVYRTSIRTSLACLAVIPMAVNGPVRA
jgi:hypothetical protein